MNKLFLFLFALFIGCSSQPPRPQPPPWTTAPTRTFDAGYLVYVGQGTDGNADNARFKAEGAALEDLANECSFAPKGARIEDRFEVTEGGITHAYAKAGLTFEECEIAKNTVQPEDVRRLANPQIALTIQKYQEMIGSPTAPTSIAEAPTTSVSDEHTYYAARQDVFLAKQEVILAPVGVFTATAPETIRYYTVVRATVMRLRQYEVTHPAYASAPHGWSHQYQAPARYDSAARVAPPRTARPRRFRRNRRRWQR